MPRVEMDVETTLPPERVRALLLDFSERRPDIWPDLEPTLYQVHSVGETSADVQEGSKLPGMTIWAREHYDWSQPGKIRWTVQESNFSTPGDYNEATLSPRPDGGTTLHIEWNRTGTTLPWKLLVGMIALTRGRPIAASLKKAFAKLEAEEG